MRSRHFAGSSTEELSRALQAGLLQMLGKPVREHVHVEIGTKLAEAGLTTFFPDAVSVLFGGSSVRAVCLCAGMAKARAGQRNCLEDQG